MENNQFKPPAGQGTRPTFKFEKNRERDRPKAGISGKLMIVGMGAIGGALAGGVVTFFGMARAAGRRGFDPSAEVGYAILAGGAVLGAIAGIIVVLFILRQEAAD